MVTQGNKIGDEGATKIAEALKVNQTLTILALAVIFERNHIILSYLLIT